MVPFNKRKDVSLKTVSTDPHRFVLQTFVWLAQQQGIENPHIDPLLKKFPGNPTDHVRIENLARAVQGFARSAQINHMFGKGVLAPYANEQDFLAAFVGRYEEKAFADVASSKREKAITPQGMARAEADRQKILTGLDMVKGYFDV